MFFWRIKFYSVFRFMELGCVASGFGYKETVNGEVSWETAVGGYMWNGETTNNP